ncbi:uncharacterized protein METZ01_LOCUS191706 [marine metagenome]|uniref:Uncharacterized protein n=1 Tax=marine metagenome TaxID=408172 RepID=A0A382DLE9_9ZZZZ
MGITNKACMIILTSEANSQSRLLKKFLSKYLPIHQSFRTAQQFRNDKFSYRWNEYQHSIFFTVSPSMIFYTLSSSRIETCGLCTRMLFLLFKHAIAEI